MKNTKAILTELYPNVVEKIKKNENQLKLCISRYIEYHAKELYDICPCDRIYFTTNELDDFYTSTQINIDDATKAISDTYYSSIEPFNPAAAKDEFTIVMICIIRYFFKINKSKELELCIIYLAFSGKFYSSIHFGLFQKFPPSEYRSIMEYVVNNKLSNKYDIKREGNVFGAIRSVCQTWLNSYKSRLNSFSDEDVVYIIQQLHNRIKSFMKNIAQVYYEVYNNKEAYLVYNSDSLDDDDYHLADSDSQIIERIVEKTIITINTTSVDYKLCKMASDSNVKTDEVKSIIETLLNDNNNLPEIKELIRLIVTEYFVVSKDKDVRNIDFITKTIAVKPNSKNPNIIREKEIIETWLMDNSPTYKRRRSREATKNSYHRSILMYFTLLIHNSNR